MMKAATCYRLVLLIYVALWGCQMFVCNSTHSLIVLTDSYINLYYIIEILLELYYLRVQTELSSERKLGKPAYRIIGRACSYQFKRLPLLGTFMNSVFLSALLMYAAIEGIQSCFHAHHLIDKGGKSIILQHELTYPSLLVGFAVLGIIMRSVLNAVHKKRDEESKSSDSDERSDNLSGCNAAALKSDAANTHSSDDLRTGANSPGSQLSIDHKSSDSPKDTSGIILKSFKINQNIDDMQGPVYIPVEHPDVSQHRDMLKASRSRNSAVKHIISPVALIACAFVIYLTPDELITEVTDAILAIVVVVVVYIASYPSMDYAGRTLLQSAPMDLNLDSLTDDLKSISPLISSVEELHVWSLTNDSGRIGSCNLLMSKDDLRDDREVAKILRDARFKFSLRGVKCSSVQPVFLSASGETDKKRDNNHKHQQVTADVECSHEHN